MTLTVYTTRVQSMIQSYKSISETQSVQVVSENKSMQSVSETKSFSVQRERRD